MQRKCLTLASTLARASLEQVKAPSARRELPAKPAKKRTPPKRGSLGYYREERYVCCLWEVGRYQAPSGRLNRVEAVSAMCAEPNPTKKTVAM